jgi:hypothetical protein
MSADKIDGAMAKSIMGYIAPENVRMCALYPIGDCSANSNAVIKSALFQMARQGRFPDNEFQSDFCIRNQRKGICKTRSIRQLLLPLIRIFSLNSAAEQAESGSYEDQLVFQRVVPRADREVIWLGTQGKPFLNLFRQAESVNSDRIATGYVSVLPPQQQLQQGDIYERANRSYGYSHCRAKRRP